MTDHDFYKKPFFQLPEQFIPRFPVNYQYLLNYGYLLTGEYNGAQFKDFNTPNLVPEGLNKPISKLVDLRIFNK